MANQSNCAILGGSHVAYANITAKSCLRLRMLLGIIKTASDVSGTSTQVKTRNGGYLAHEMGLGGKELWLNHDMEENGTLLSSGSLAGRRITN